MTGFWFLAMHYVMSRDVMASFGDITWSHTLMSYDGTSQPQHDTPRTACISNFVPTAQKVFQQEAETEAAGEHICAQVIAIGDMGRSCCLLITLPHSREC